MKLSSPVATRLDRMWLGVACGVAFLAVAGGAFGAHGLQGRVSEQALGWWETGARYAMFHVVGLLAVSLQVGGRATRRARIAGALFTFGVLLFTGSLWTMTLTGVRALGAVTPFGGVAFLAGWVALATTASAPEQPREHR
jgi:uncharacterized membrane protein YgdD (TMEM256/DUF423 family)